MEGASLKIKHMLNFGRDDILDIFGEFPSEFHTFHTCILTNDFGCHSSQLLQTTKGEPTKQSHHLHESSSRV